jgi:hypothetical protein
MAEPETYPCGSLHCWAQGPYLGKLPVRALLTSITATKGPVSDKLLRRHTKVAWWKAIRRMSMPIATGYHNY